jgi:fatty-acyl-CoA synthase
MEPVPADGRRSARSCSRQRRHEGLPEEPEATAEAFAGGWFHSGDLGVLHPDGYIQLKDRSKDIIISGGENISSIEVEDVLYKHPHVIRRRRRPARREMGRDALRLRRAAPERQCQRRGHHRLLPGALALSRRRAVVFCELPKTSTGKIQKFALRELRQ